MRTISSPNLGAKRVKDGEEETPRAEGVILLVD